MTWAGHRLSVEGIKGHPFFYGADWDSLRYIAPPFVPALQSITDTSYFPTDDLGNLPDQLQAMESLGSEKDLAFLGQVMFWESAVYARLTIFSLDSRSNGLQRVKTIDDTQEWMLSQFPVSLLITIITYIQLQHLVLAELCMEFVDVLRDGVKQPRWSLRLSPPHLTANSVCFVSFRVLTLSNLRCF